MKLVPWKIFLWLFGFFLLHGLFTFFFHICSYNVVKQSIDILLEIGTVYIKTQYRSVLFNKRINKKIYLSSLTWQYNLKY